MTALSSLAANIVAQAANIAAQAADMLAEARKYPLSRNQHRRHPVRQAVNADSRMIA